MATNFEVLLKDFPDWAVPMTKVIPLFYTTSGNNIDDDNVNLNYNFDYWFQKMDNQHYLLKIYLSGVLQRTTETLETLPLFVDLKLYILNERIYDNPQHNRYL